ncbi:MAG TPA: DUF2252 domain-containing protein [Chthoniobacteraceae bacterium]|nr:DUF2252 domain-containing protein [Chthoniobacteraceae bacterium]
MRLYSVSSGGRFSIMSIIRIPSPQERRAEGKKLRDRMKRVDQARWHPSGDRDILAIIRDADKGRLPQLLPIKMGRMSASPFSFFRGTAPLMARDLAHRPVTGLRVQLCGDAHVRNLGAYAAPDGHLVFDINDFDETIRGPWEWDLKRLAASMVLAGREAGESDKACACAAEEVTRVYRESMDQFSRMKVIELAKFAIRRETENECVRDVLDKAERVTPARTLKKLTEGGKNEAPRFHDQSPVLRHVPRRVAEEVLKSFKEYRGTVTAGRQLILDAYHPVDVAFKVVGTGSVGTRDYVVLLLAGGIRDPLFLQFKEELRSCYSPYMKDAEQYDHEGRRVAQGQQRMQTVTDPFLGWTTIQGRHFLVRQLADHKAAIDPGELCGETLLEYAVVCGKALAKAHARTGDAQAMAGYCGDTPKLDKAIAIFAMTYADQTAADYGIFAKAIKAGKIKATAEK